MKQIDTILNGLKDLTPDFDCDKFIFNSLIGEILYHKDLYVAIEENVNKGYKFIHFQKLTEPDKYQIKIIFNMSENKWHYSVTKNDKDLSHQDILLLFSELNIETHLQNHDCF